MNITLHPRRHQRGFIGQCIIAGLVLIVGGIILLKLVKTCKKCLPASPPPPAKTNKVAGLTGYDSAAWLPMGTGAPDTNGGCDCGCTFTFTYTISTNEHGDYRCELSDPFIPSDYESIDTITNYGLAAPSGLTPSYNTNSLSIALTPAGFVIGDGGVGSVVLRSTNFVDWDAVVTNWFPVGYVFIFNDGGAPCSKAFYRVEVLR